MRRWILAAMFAVLLHVWLLARAARWPTATPELAPARPELVSVDVEPSAPKPERPPSPTIRPRAPAPRAAARVAIAASAESASTVVVAVDDAEPDEQRDGVGGGRYYELWKLDTLPVPERSSAEATLDAGSDFLISLTVTGSGQVVGVLVGDAQLPEVPPEIRRALRRQRFVAATVDGMSVSTTFPVHLRLVRDADCGVTDWEVSNPGWILRK